MIKAIRVENFRSIVDSGWINLAPITVVVGKNSAGKSSFLRTFPLLKQSMEADTKEPLLWYGRLVDFGAFSDVVSKYGGHKSLSMGFKVVTSPTVPSEYVVQDEGQIFVYYEERGSQVFLDRDVELIAKLTLEKRSGAQGTFVKSVSIRVADDEIEVFGNQDGSVESVRIGSETVQPRGEVRFLSLRNGFFPSLQSTGDSIGSDAIRVRRDGPFFDLIASRLDGFFHGNTKTQTKRGSIRKLRWGIGRSFYSHLTKLIPNVESKVGWAIDGDEPEEIKVIRLLVLLRSFNEILASANGELRRAATSVKYLAPVRATASRYYRFQELAVDQIDPQGENVPMFLNSLTDSQRRELEEWMSVSLGFRVIASRSGEGHTALFVSEGANELGPNLADTGFGYSQILPVALQIWKSLQDARLRGPRRQHLASMIVIEQPELHLHPQFQAALSDIFASSVAGGGRGRSGISFLIETHSEHLVNRLGELVQKGELSPSDVQVVLFDKTSPNDPTSVRSATFGENGVLIGEWPFGFFIPNLP